jgi:hypothetical protein
MGRASKGQGLPTFAGGHKGGPLHLFDVAPFEPLCPTLVLSAADSFLISVIGGP